MRNYDTVDNLMGQIWQKAVDRQLKARRAYRLASHKDDDLEREYRDAIIAQEAIYDTWQQLKGNTP